MAIIQRPSKAEETEKLSPEETAAFELGLLSEATGVDYSFEDCVEFARERRRTETEKISGSR